MWNFLLIGGQLWDRARPYSYGAEPLRIGEVGRWLRISWPFLPVACALLLWTTSLPSIDPTRMNDLGLVSVLPPAFFLAVFLLVASFSFLIVLQPRRARIILLHIIMLILMIHATPALTYETLRYSWAWKHVGMIDYFQRFGSVNLMDTHFSAYHNWPGFFALSTLVTEAAGLESALSFAGWAPVYFNLLSLGALFLIFKALTRDPRLVWLALWFYFLANWVGQDYFSPQAFNYSLHLILLGICLMWFRYAPQNSQGRAPFLHRFKPMTILSERLCGPGEADVSESRQIRPLERVGLLLIVILLMSVIAFSHQLTPAMTISSLAALVVFRRISPSGLPLLMAVLTITWLGYFAVDFLKDIIGPLLETAARFLSNAESTVPELSQLSPGQVLVVLIGRALTVFVVSLALLGGLRRFISGYRDFTAVILMLSPIVPMVISAYEGEMIFRVYLFALPFIAFFAAAAVFPSWSSGTSIRTGAILVVLSSLLLGGFFFSHFGKDRQYHFTQNEFEAAQFLYDVAPPGSLLIEGTSNYPSRFKNYEIFTYVDISLEPLPDRLTLVNNPVEVLSLWMNDDRYPATYLIITRSQKAGVDDLGTMQPGSLDRIEEALRQSLQFRLIYYNQDASIFVLSNSS